jgi:hypothetical protein
MKSTSDKASKRKNFADTKNGWKTLLILSSRPSNDNL